MPTIKEWKAFAAERLETSGITEPQREAVTLVAYALGTDRAHLIVNSEKTPSPDQEHLINSYIERRSAHEPFQYIVGKQEFYGLDFLVTPDVLIPRPETEFAVEESLAILSSIAKPRFCEVGVGSGCISVAILKNSPNASAIGLDVSEAALAVAEQNAERHGVSDRIKLIRSDVYSMLKPEQVKFDLIVSNPPYIPADDIDELQPEVKDHEPLTALTDGHDGTTLIKKIIDDAPIFLKDGGSLVMEIGFSQSEHVMSLFPGELWRNINVINDLQGIPRIVSAAYK